MTYGHITYFLKKDIHYVRYFTKNYVNALQN